MRSTIGKGRILRTDSISNVRIVPPTGIAAPQEQQQTSPIQVIQAVEVELPKNTYTHGLVLEDMKEVEAHILQLDHDGKVVRIPSRPVCASSETSIYAYMYDDTDESDGGFISGSVTEMTPVMKREYEEEYEEQIEEEEEVKRVTFAPSSETNIYAYHDIDETEEEQYADNGGRRGYENYEDEGTEDHVFEETVIEETDRVITVDSSTQMKEVSYPVTSSITALHKTIDINGNEVKPTDKPEELEEAGNGDNVIHYNKVVAKQSNHVIINQCETSQNDKKPVPSTSEVQLQLTHDLKTLEDIVKRLYTKLNQKGPVTIVANFKPKKDGELALDMSSLTGNPNMQIESANAEQIEENSAPQTEVKKIKSNDQVRETGEQGTHSSKTEWRMELLQQRAFSRSTAPATVNSSPVSIMKNASSRLQTKQSNLPSNSMSPRSPQSSTNVGKPPVYSTKTWRGATNRPRTSRDINNNVTEEHTRKPTLKQRKSKLPSIQPATSSHSVNETPIFVGKAEVKPQASSLSSKHHLMEGPSSQRILVDKNGSQQYAVLEPSNSNQRYLVPVSSSPIRSSSQHVLVKAPQQSQHLFVETANSHPQQFILGASPSQQILLENLQPKQQIIHAPSPSIQHILVENPPPPTCPNPHLHPRTATILPAPQSNTRNCTYSRSYSALQERQSYRLIQPCDSHRQLMHPNRSSSRERRTHVSSRRQKRKGNREISEESAGETGDDRMSDASSASSKFSGINGNINRSEDDTVPEEEEQTISIPIRISTTSQPSNQQKHPQDSNSIHSITVDARTNKSSRLVASPSNTKRQSQASFHIPSGPQKLNSYSALYKEKKQQNKQTVYVDLTTKGHNKNS